MKIGLVGTPGSGKTTFFASIYHEYRSNVFPAPADGEISGYVPDAADLNMSVKPVGTELDATLKALSKFFSKPAITKDDWPDGNVELDKRGIDVTYFFRTPRSEFKRRFTFYDPPGGIFTGVQPPSVIDSLTSQIRTCDAAIVFLPALDILRVSGDRTTIDKRTATSLRSELGLGIIRDTLEHWGRERPDAGQTGFPITFILSQADAIPERQVDGIMDFLYGYTREVTAAFERLIVCTTFVSLIERVGALDVYAPTNIEIPFVFSTAGAILRHMNELILEAEQKSSLASAYEMMAGASAKKYVELKVMYDENPFGYFFEHHLRGEGFSAQRERAERLNGRANDTSAESRKRVAQAESELKLLTYLLNVIADVIGDGVEQRGSGTAVWRGGERVDPLDILAHLRSKRR